MSSSKQQIHDSQYITHFSRHWTNYSQQQTNDLQNSITYYILHATVIRICFQAKSLILNVSEIIKFRK